MARFIYLLLLFLISDSFFAQAWLQTHHLLNIPNKPATTSLGNIVAVNGGNQIGSSSLPAPGVIKTLRDFYHMEIDYNYSYFPSDGILNADTCSCSNVWCNNGNCNSFINNPGGPSSFSSKKGFYCAWNGAGYQFDEIYSSLESIFPKSTTHGGCTNTSVSRSYPNKWYSLTEWGGLANIEQNFTNYLIPYLTTYCPTDTARPCLIDVLEIGNEPWGDPYPGEAGYHKLLNAAISTFQSFYGSNNPEDWRMKLSTAALEAHDANPGNYGATEMYVEDMVPANLRPFFDYVSIHPYAFPLDNSYFSIGERPESENGAFLTLKNLVSWRNAQMPSAKVNITEFGWNAGVLGDGCGPLGESTQASYTMRAFLLAARNDVHRAFVYSMGDNHEPPLFCTTGLYQDLSGNNPRKTHEVIQKLKTSTISDKRFLKALVESADQPGNGLNGAYIYLFGDATGKPTHLVAWRPDSLSYENNVYPTVSSSYYTVNLPDTSIKVLNGSGYYYLGWDNLLDGTVANNSSTLVDVVGNGSSTFNIKLSATPVVVPLATSNCVYDTLGLLDCSGIITEHQSRDFVAPEISVFPNPAKNSINVNYLLSDYLEEVNLSVINMFGQTVESKNIKPNATTKIETTSIKNGIYLLVFKNERGQTQVKKIQVLRN